MATTQHCEQCGRELPHTPEALSPPQEAADGRRSRIEYRRCPKCLLLQASTRALPRKRKQRG